MVRFLPWMHGLLALALYGVNANFTILLFTSGFAGWEQGVRFVFALAFEGSKIALWLEGLLRKNLMLLVLGIAFSVGSLTTATLGMIMSELMQGEAQEVQAASENLAVEQATAAVARINKEIEIEQNRLAGGDVRYRTDAKETRARMDELGLQLGKAEQALRDAVAQRRADQTTENHVDENPLAAISKRLGPAAQNARLGFGAYQALMLELGGLATSALAFAKRKKDPEETPREEPQAEAAHGEEPEELLGEPEAIDDSSPTTRLGAFVFDHKARNGMFPQFARVGHLVSRVDYDRAIERGILAGVLRRRRGRVYIAPEIDRETFVKEVTSWPL